MLEKHDRIIAANRRPQKSDCIESIGREDHAHSRRVRENALAALRVIDCSPGEITSDCDAHHAGRRECTIRAPAHYRKLIAELHHCWPNIVEELNFHDRLQATHRHPYSSPHDAGLSNRRIEDPLRTKIALQSCGQLEDAALALDHLLLQIFIATAVGDILAENYYALVAFHLIAQGGVDEVRHCFWRGLLFLSRMLGHSNLGIERWRGGIKIGRIQILFYGFRLGQGCG